MRSSFMRGLALISMMGVSLLGCQPKPSCPSCVDCPPKIAVTYLPPAGSIEPLKGGTEGIDCTLYELAIWIQVDNIWWVKPFADEPLTDIVNEEWACDITTGGHDDDATAIRIYAVPADFNAQVHVLPQTNEYIAVCEVVRQ